MGLSRYYYILGQLGRTQNVCSLPKQNRQLPLILTAVHQLGCTTSPAEEELTDLLLDCLLWPPDWPG